MTSQVQLLHQRASSSSKALLKEKDIEKERILMEIKKLEKKYKIGFTSSTAQDECDAAECVQNVSGEENEEFILPDNTSDFETDNEFNTESSMDDNQISLPMDTIEIKVEPCEEEFVQKCQTETNSPCIASSCKNLDCSIHCTESSMDDNQISLPMDTTKIKVEPCEEEFIQKYHTETNPSQIANSCKNVNLNTHCIESSIDDNQISFPLDTIKIKVEHYEKEFDKKCLSGTNSPPAASSCKNLDCNMHCACSCPSTDKPGSTSHNPVSHLSLTDFEVLFKVIRYLDDHANEDMFDTAEKYYILKLRSVARAQQMLARTLINKVLIAAEKENLNSYLGLFHNDKVKSDKVKFDKRVESKIQTYIMQNVSYNIHADCKQADDHVQQQFERGYLCPGRNKLIDKMKESLKKSMKQDRSVMSYAPQLRALSTVQFSFADKLINEIISAAVTGNLRSSSDVQLPFLRQPQKSLKSVQSIPNNETKNIPPLISESSIHSLKEPVSLSPNKYSCENLKSLPGQKQTFIAIPTHILGKNSHLLSAQNSSLPTSKTPETSQALKQNSDVSSNSTSVSSGPGIPCSNQSNSVAFTQEPSTTSAHPSQILLIQIESLLSSTLNRHLLNNSLGNNHLPNKEKTLSQTTEQAACVSSTLSSLTSTKTLTVSSSKQPPSTVPSKPLLYRSVASFVQGMTPLPRRSMRQARKRCMRAFRQEMQVASNISLKKKYEFF